MNILLFLLIFTSFIKTYLCDDIRHLFQKINNDTIVFNSIAAKLAWESSLHPDNPDLPKKAASYQKIRIPWLHNTCNKLVSLNNAHLLNNTQRRQTYLLCRGPKFTYNEARITSSLYEELQTIYSNAEICLPNIRPISINNLTEVEQAILDYLANVKKYLQRHNDSIGYAAKIAVDNNENGFCLRGEEDFEKLMKYSRNEEVLKWLWLVWREKVGPPMREPYKDLVEIENKAAKRNGYTDIGASWRDELEIPNLRSLCRQLYDEVRPLYSLLHGVTRFFLRKRYGDIVPKRGAIPAYLLGNLWAQNWEPLADLIIERNIDLDENIKSLNWTVMHMVKRAEDFYQSMGLPPMTEAFWRESVFARENNEATRCHGSAADMFQDGDYRLLYCSDTSADDFYVLHHEMGHIQYYMAYEQQPGIFRQGNGAFHESIGDTIMYGVMTPQHLNRLGLVNDSILYRTNVQQDYNDYALRHDINEVTEKDPNVIDEKTKVETGESVKVNTDDILMLKLALNKIPQIPFALLMDEFRWAYFEGRINDGSLNRMFWQMALDLQGIAPPQDRGEEYFDVGAKFHVADNTAFIRYFLSSFIQHQLFESLCKAAVFGRRGVTEDLPSTITMNRCDIYGSKASGKLLKDFMSRGNSQHWRDILQATTGRDSISSSALKRYYRPLYKFLANLVQKYHIPIGW